MNFNEINIKQLSSEEAPFELLLLADPSPKMVNSYLNQCEIFAAALKSEIIGIILLSPIQENTIEIKNISVKPNYQNKGLGKLLLHHAEEFAIIKGYSKLRICTGNSSLNQILLYQKMEYLIIEEVENFFPQHYAEPIFENGILCTNLIILEKEISSS
ncbi:GNAT family N-acetyltransferase [Cyclobacteriaceae bacterium YHN15]|jgi:ribosomal protein S18 acetylase RimI-like enzyme|nr:GNAT family N-acetyltransferase [Cyclobacteriaceae bacterium YHN15]